MKKKYIARSIFFTGTVLVIILMYYIVVSYHSYSDIFYEHLEQISYYEGDVITSISACEIQRVNGYMYYFNKAGDLCRKGEEQKEEILLSGVTEFLVEEDTLYYIYEDDTKDGIYCRTIGSQNERKVLEGEIYMFAIGKNVNITYDVNNLLCMYDKNWNKQNMFDVEKTYDEEIFFVDMQYVEGHIIFSFYKDVFIYSIEKNEMIKLIPPIDTKDNDIIFDIIKKGNKLYYLVCAHEYSDLYTRYERIDCKENGIYQVDVKNGKLSKVSDDCGFYLMCLNDELYVIDSGMFIYTIQKVDLINEPER